MEHVFTEAATEVDIPSVQQWKHQGGKVVGYTCSFMPVEPFHAAGILPIRLRGINAGGMDISDAYFGPFVCSFPKALLQLAGSGKYDFLDGAVISNGCDTLRRLDDCWRKLGEDIQGTIPSWFYYFDVPHKPDGHAFEWYANQVRKLISAIEKQFDVSITDEKLKNAISVQNRVRKLIWKLEQFRLEEPAKITGTEAYAAIIAGTVMPQDLYAEYLSDYIDLIENRKQGASLVRKRIFLAGSICDDFELVKLIEQSGTVVVGENICFAVRGENDLVSETGDPVEALTAKYLSASVCPRMMGYYRDRKGMIMERIKKISADGVIMQNIRFCDLHGSENGLLARDFETAGIPSLRIEREHGALTETGRLKMRLDAFVEQLSSKRRAYSI